MQYWPFPRPMVRNFAPFHCQRPMMRNFAPFHCSLKSDVQERATGLLFKSQYLTKYLSILFPRPMVQNFAPCQCLSFLYIIEDQAKRISFHSVRGDCSLKSDVQEEPHACYLSILWVVLSVPLSVFKFFSIKRIRPNASHFIVSEVRGPRTCMRVYCT